ncbi:MAG: XRE family transcriptional regulator [Terriglobia bacterium]|nr:MAG: XRE family transcriptional regulator [Terriglobia bacterium]
MQRAYLASDGAYNGLFFVAVRTTGIFCLPSCSAKKPLPENVEYFGSVKDALFAGYRPCKRCRPTENSAPDWVRGLLDRIAADPMQRVTEGSLRELGLEPARVRRFFVREYGLTFQGYCRALRLGKAFEKIRNGGPLDEAVFDSGFDSHSGFRTAFEQLFGKPPGRTREADGIRVFWMETPIGPMIAGATDQGVCLLEFTERRMLEAQFATLRRRFDLPIFPGESSHLEQLRAELAEYFAGRLREFGVPLVYPGTPFETQVWTELRQIPYGETRSYEDLARIVGRPGASRAVGRANGMNRIAIVIPCHRVVNKDGNLCGYGGGLWRKRILLDLERTGASVGAVSG